MPEASVGADYSLDILLQKLDAYLREKSADQFEVNIGRGHPARLQRLIELRDAKAKYDRSIGKRPSANPLASRAV